MFISFIVSSLIPIILSPIWINHLYELEYEDQRRKIHLDNSAIRLGRADRALFDKIEKANKSLKMLHQIYHKASAGCMLTGAGTSCLFLTQRLKEGITSFVERLYQYAGLVWISNESRIPFENSKEQIKIRVIERETNPFKKTKCHACFIAFQVQIKKASVNTSLGDVNHPLIQNRVELKKINKLKWNYLLW